jgi:Bacterial extracellular solute-binding protein
VKPTLGELAGEFERTTGHKVTITYDTAGAVRNRILADEVVDVAIIQRPVVEALMHQGKISRELDDPTRHCRLRPAGDAAGAAEPAWATTRLQSDSACRSVVGVPQFFSGLAKRIVNDT